MEVYGVMVHIWVLIFLPSICIILLLKLPGFIAIEKYKSSVSDISAEQKESLVGLTHDFLAKNRYSYESHNLLFTEPEKKSYNDQIAYWKDYFQKPALNRGLPNTLIADKEEIRQLTSFFAWAAWASAAMYPVKTIPIQIIFLMNHLLGMDLQAPLYYGAP